MRIEDDVLVTETGMENLTTGWKLVCYLFRNSNLFDVNAAPRTIADIEAVMAQRLPWPLFEVRNCSLFVNMHVACCESHVAQRRLERIERMWKRGE